MPRRRPVSNISLATQLSLVALVVTLVSLTVTATVGLVRGSDLAEDVINARLTSLASSRAQAVELYVGSIQREVAALSVSPATRESIRELGDAVIELNADPVDPQAARNVTEYYLTDVVPRLEQVGGDGVGASFLVPEQPASIYLQDAYTVPKTVSEDDTDTDERDDDATEIEPELVLDPGDGSAYSALHPGVHKTFGQIGIRSGYDDIFLIDARNDTVVYSLRKRIDFATSLDLGPHSGSALARAIDDLSADPSQTSRLSVMSAYVPAIESPTSFVASPVLDGDVIVGYVAIALSFERFDDVISGGGTWQTYGDAGEAYLVAGDATMVTTTRLFDESPSVFLAQASEPGPGQLSDAQRRRIATTGTTALVQPVDLELVLGAADGPSLTSGTNYRGVSVRTASRPLDLDGVRWTIFVEGESEELDRSIARYARDMLFAVALFVVVVTFIAVRWSNRLVAPIRAIAARLRSARALEPTTAATTDDELRARGPDEYVDLSDNVDQMLLRLRERQEAMVASSRERTSLLQQFLPVAVARRSEEVGGEVLDHVHRASVVVLEAHGLGDMVGDVPEQDVRDLWAEVVDEIDALAADQGIERVKLAGGSYYAVCGVSRPLLDHAPRTVAFALAARDLVHELSDDRLTLSAGVAEGPVSVGLAVKTSLVYDVWGDTVNEAEELERSAPPGTVLVSSSVRAQLPDEYLTVGDPEGGAVAVTARLARQETST